MQTGQPGLMYPADASLVYARYLGASLRSRCEDMAKAGMGLESELQIARALVCDALVSYEESRRVCEVQVEAKKMTAVVRGQIMAAAGQYVHGALDKVREMAVACAKIAESSAMDPIAVRAVLFQATKAVDNMLMDNAPMLESAGLDPRAMADEVAQRLEAIQSVGETVMLMTNVMPDADDEARAMDETVPARPQGQVA